MELVRRRTLIQRMKGAALLQADAYEEVEADTTATGQAALVVGLVALAAAIGGAGAGAAGFWTGLLSAYLGWLLWSAVTYLIGDKVLGGTATWGELLRTLGFAQTPGILYIFGIFPSFLGWLVRFIVGTWILIAVIVAIRQALDFGTGKAVLTAILGAIAYFIVGAIVALILGIGPDFV
jgi:hypothetical protein